MRYEKNNNIAENESICYKEVDGLRLPMNVYYPKDGLKEKNIAVVCIHGGGWHARRDNSPWSGDYLYHQAKYFSLLGYVGIAISYRSIDYTKHTDILDLIDDCRDALSYIKENLHYVDYDRLIVLGESAGGHLAVNLGFLEDKSLLPYSIIAVNPVLDCTRQKWHYCSRLETIQKQVSPLLNVKKTPVKFLIAHGDEDSVVEYSDSLLFYKKMVYVGNSCDFLTAKGQNHAYLLYGYKSPDSLIDIEMSKIVNYIHKVL